MKTAGYDIALLINEGLLNQISGALFYSGFLTTHGSVDFYNGKISVKNNIKNFYETVSTTLKEKVPAEMHRYLKIDFRFKPTYEPFVDFIDDIGNIDNNNNIANNRIRIGTALRIYLWLWESLEIIFDASLSVVCGINIDNNGIIAADFANSDIEEFNIKYNGGTNQEIAISLNNILNEAIRLYFTGRVVSFELQLPSLEQHISGIEIDEKNLRINSTYL